MRLPPASFWSPVRTDMGTIATRSCVELLAAAIDDRNATTLAHIAITTSLSVVPNAFLTAFASSSESEVIAYERCGESAWFHEARGAENGAGGGRDVRLAVLASEVEEGHRTRAGERAQRTSRAVSTSDRIAYASSSTSFGTCSGAQVSAPTSRPSGSTSSMATVISLPDTPSIAAWWVFVSTAM